MWGGGGGGDDNVSFGYIAVIYVCTCNLYDFCFLCVLQMVRVGGI